MFRVRSVEGGCAQLLRRGSFLLVRQHSPRAWFVEVMASAETGLRSVPPYEPPAVEHGVGALPERRTERRRESWRKRQHFRQRRP